MSGIPAVAIAIIILGMFIVVVSRLQGVWGAAELGARSPRRWLLGTAIFIVVAIVLITLNVDWFIGPAQPRSEDVECSPNERLRALENHSSPLFRRCFRRELEANPQYDE